MRKLNLFSLAFATMMLGACSSDEIAVNGNGSGPQWNAEGNGYVNLAIQLPTQPSTRAVSFDDGTPEEYEVKDATLILFVDDNVNSAYSMNLNFSPVGSSTDEITTTAKITQKINSVSGTTIQALVVLNNNNLFSISEGNALMIGGQAFNGTLSQLNDKIKEQIGVDYNWHEAGYLMSNAIMANAAGGATAPTDAAVVDPLVTIDAEKIYSTAAEADANPAATIYVERAEAKVTVKGTAEGNTTDGKNLAYTIKGWALDNTNQTNKLVRDVTGFDTWKAYASTKAPGNYRFIGGSAIASGLYRVYWGDDYNYSGTISPTGLTTVGGAAATIDNGNMKAIDGTAAEYCFENTTDIDNMLETNLTRVIVKATFNDGASFYTIDGDRSEIWTEANVKKEVAARLLTDVTFNNWAKANLNTGETLKSDEDFDVAFTTEAAGKRTVATITLNATGEGKLKDGHDTYPANAADLANNHISLEFYANGDAYYPVYIKHFGDDETPWTEEDYPGSVIYGTPASAQDYLGRYGVLRNNWYEITVTGIKSLGDPNVTRVEPEPVDKKESYISVEINILSWAKRSQNVEL